MKTGLTLVEMIIVVAVIAMLATMVIGIASHIDTQSKERATEATFALLEGALDEYKDFTDNFPDANYADPNKNSEFLYEKLNSIPGSKKVLQEINDKLIQNKFEPLAGLYEIYDLWGTVLDYRYDLNYHNFPLLKSAGKDRTFGTPDDISNR